MYLTTPYIRINAALLGHRRRATSFAFVQSFLLPSPPARRILVSYHLLPGPVKARQPGPIFPFLSVSRVIVFANCLTTIRATVLLREPREPRNSRERESTRLAGQATARQLGLSLGSQAS